MLLKQIQQFLDLPHRYRELLAKYAALSVRTDRLENLAEADMLERSWCGRKMESGRSCCSVIDLNGITENGPLDWWCNKADCPMPERHRTIYHLRGGKP